MRCTQAAEQRDIVQHNIGQADDYLHTVEVELRLTVNVQDGAEREHDQRQREPQPDSSPTLDRCAKQRQRHYAVTDDKDVEADEAAFVLERVERLAWPVMRAEKSAERAG